MLFGVQWYFWLILALAIILLIFAWRKAIVSSRERRERLRKEAALWKRDYELRENFSVLTQAKLKETEDTELLHGVAMNIQVALEKASDMAAAFEALPEEKKYIYALEYFDEDSKKALSVFFKNNGKPLVPVVPEALAALELDEYIEYFRRLAPMYDDDTEVSVDYSIISKADEEFAEIYDSHKLCLASAAFIRKHKEIFLS